MSPGERPVIAFAVTAPNPWRQCGVASGSLAQERNLPAGEIAKLMYKRVGTGHAMAFCKKHNVSLEWLMCGDLRGLAQMAKQQKDATRTATTRPPAIC
jgi:hypothetical protein